MSLAIYQEGPNDTFRFDGIYYVINDVFKLAHNLPVDNLLVRDLSWIIGQGDDLDENGTDEFRISNADLEAPILVVIWNKKFATVDGIHRVAKADRQKQILLPGKILTQEILDQCVCSWQKPEITKERLEELFGSEEVLGLKFVDHNWNVGEPRIYTAAEYDAQPPEKQNLDSTLPNGGSGTCCTDYARLVHTMLPGRVQIVGFLNEDNPESRIVKDKMHPQGHDFALVDGRFLVDPWVRFVAGAEWAKDRVVFDLHAEAELIAELYGPKERWARSCLVESYNVTTDIGPRTDWYGKYLNAVRKRREVKT